MLINGGGGTNTLFQLGSDLTLSGGGVVQMNVAGGGGNAFLRGSGVTLTNAGDTIQGAGFIGDSGALAVVNGSSGTLLANVSGGTLNVNAAGGSFLNNGTVMVASGATMTVTGDANGFLQNQAMGGGTPVTQVDGALNAPHGVNIDAGVLKGTGTVVGNVNNTGGAVAPGDSPASSPSTATTRKERAARSTSSLPD